ncbi:MAG: DUF2252 domain-containing protein [Gammaproteobacteria bacterium]|nr:MAG: DUF2252 domain-containing protein [Gammaproteobacteria bacterium]
MRVAERIYRYNAGRDPQLLQRKYARLATDPFVFLRGTCHLFYADWHGGRRLDTAPRAWICGDLHLENFGSYKGDNRLAYFDLNDFDEAALAPCTWEIARVLVSLHVAARSLGLGLREARALSRCFLDHYAAALASDKPRWIERSLARGMIGALLSQVELRRRRDFLDQRTQRDGKLRRLLIDSEKLIALHKDEREQLLAWFEKFAATQPDPKLYRPLDAAVRVAGTGSLGLTRYAILVRGAGSPHGNLILDMKIAVESAAASRLARAQPTWPDEATRIVTVQQRAQAIAPAFLTPVHYAGRDFVLKELQPSQDRLDLQSVEGALKPLSGAISAMGQLVAWSALRGSARQGAANADELVEFARVRTWLRPLIEYAEDYARQVGADWREFRSAWQDEHKTAPARRERGKR